MRLALEVRKQLRGICVKLELPIESCGQDFSVLRKCLAFGFFMNAAELQKEGEFISVSATQKNYFYYISVIIFQLYK